MKTSGVSGLNLSPYGLHTTKASIESHSTSIPAAAPPRLPGRARAGESESAFAGDGGVASAEASAGAYQSCFFDSKKDLTDI